MMRKVKCAGSETPVQFIDAHHSPGAPIDDHGDPMAIIPGQRWFIYGQLKILGKNSSRKLTCSGDNI